jgi:hypothetical protein
VATPPSPEIVYRLTSFEDAVQRIAGSPLVQRYELLQGGGLTEDGRLAHPEEVMFVIEAARQRGRTAFVVIFTDTAPDATVADLTLALQRIRAQVEAARWAKTEVLVVVD